MPTVLLVDDDRSLRVLLEARISDRGIRVVACASGEEALAQLAGNEVDVVVTDLQMPGVGGLELCSRIVAKRPDLPVVVLTAHASVENSVGAIRAGAYDFHQKPVEIETLVFTLERAIRLKSLKEEVKQLRRAARTAPGFDELLGASPAMREVFDFLDKIADLDMSVLISGETGTGKELVARAIHRKSRRRDAPFVAVNCAAVPEALLESELFGHVRGAFTDAKTDHPGLFQQAHGGTLFLDELGDLPLRLQPKLLRALQERTVRPVGGDREIPFDARLLAATNLDLESAVEDKTFREDLFYRINVLHLHLPPLRARGGDVLLCARQFVSRCAATLGKPVAVITPAAAARLLAYSWPGNIRELQNCIERAVALAGGDSIGEEDLPERIRDYRKSHVLVASEDSSELVPLVEVERRYILRVLEATAGNKARAAQVLGIDRRTLYRKLEHLAVPSIIPPHRQ